MKGAQGRMLIGGAGRNMKIPSRLLSRGRIEVPSFGYERFSEFDDVRVRGKVGFDEG